MQTSSFFAPNGEVIPAVIRPPGFRGNSEEMLAQLSRDAGLTIDAETNLSHWDGERPDYDWITTVMTDRRRSRHEEFCAAAPAERIA